MSLAAIIYAFLKITSNHQMIYRNYSFPKRVVYNMEQPARFSCIC